MFLAVSSDANRAFCRGRYSSVFQSRPRRSSSPCAFFLFIKAAAGLVAKHFSLEHLAEEIGQLQIVTFVTHVLGHIAYHVSQNVESNQIKCPKGRRSRPADCRAGQRVHFLNSQIQLLHQPITLSTEKVPMRLAMKFGVSLAMLRLCRDTTSEKFDTASIERRIAIRRRNDFQQAHVSWRIKKVRAKPRLTEVCRKSLGNFRYRKPAGVGGDDRSRFAELFLLSGAGCA